MSLLKALGGGLIGAAALTAIHETARRIFQDAPRMDLLGMRALAKTARAAGFEAPPKDELFGITMAGDIVANSLYYSIAGLGDARHAALRGAALGLAAGVGAVLLPGPLGLGTDASARTPATQAMTVAWYTAGGIAAGAAMQLLSAGEQDNRRRRRITYGGRRGNG